MDKLSDTEILNWLDMNISSEIMEKIFKEDCLDACGGPVGIRSAVTRKVEKGYF